MKKLRFNIFFLLCFPGISYAMKIDNTPKKLSEKAQKVGNFLKKLNIDETNKNAVETIAHFNLSEAGIPICIKKNSHPSFKRYYNEDSYWFNNNDIDTEATDIAQKLRTQTKIDPNINIPILKRNFFYDNGKINWADSICKGNYLTSNGGYKEEYHIEMNTSLNKYYRNTIAFRLAHELAHYKLGSRAYKNLLITKIILGSCGLLLSYAALKNYTSCTKPAICALATFGSTLLGNLFKGYFNQQEEKACDEYAIKICYNAGYDGLEGIKEHCSLQIKTHFSDNNGIVAELIKSEKPLEYTTWEKKLFASHPSPAERVRYCEAYAEKHSYNLPNKKQFARADE